MDPKEMTTLLTLMKEQGVAEFTYTESPTGNVLSVKFAGVAPVAVGPVAVAPAAPAVAPAPAPVAAAPADNSRVIRAPIVGTFYRAPAPDKPVYVQVGDKVRKGQVVCIVEAMKLMNQIESDLDGVVTDILVENGAPVQFGQELFRVGPG